MNPFFCKHPSWSHLSGSNFSIQMVKNGTHYNVPWHVGLLKECVPFSTTSMVVFNVSSIHMPLLVVEGARFNCGVDFLFCGSGARGRFYLFDARFVAGKYNMLVCFLWGIMQFMIIFLVLGLTSSNLVECVLAPQRVYLFLPYKQPKNPKNLVYVKTLLKHVHGLL